MPPHPPASPALVMFVSVYLWAILAAWFWTINRLRAGRPLIEGKNVGLRAVPWGGGTVLAVAFLYFVVQTVVFALIDRLLRGPHAPRLSPAIVNSESFALEQMVLSAVINMAIIVLIPLVLSVGSGSTLRALGLDFDRGRSGRDLARGVVGCLLVSPIVYGIQFAAVNLWKPKQHPMETMILHDHSVPVVVLAFLSGAVLAPIGEELLFRGVLMGWLTKFCERFDLARRKASVVMPRAAAEPSLDEWLTELKPAEGDEAGAYGGGENTEIVQEALPPSTLVRWLPNLMTSLLFAGIHFEQWPAPVAIFPLSLALGALYQRTGRLGASMALHATFNFVSTVMVFAALR